jgi:hypothetical protein
MDYKRFYLTYDRLCITTPPWDLPPKYIRPVRVYVLRVTLNEWNPQLRNLEVYKVFITKCIVYHVY